MTSSDRLSPGSDSSRPIKPVTSGDDADDHLNRIFERRVAKSPDQPVWVAYRFLTSRQGGRPRRAYRVMVHLPGTKAEGYSGLLPDTLRGWLAYRFMVGLCQLHPTLRTARWP